MSEVMQNLGPSAGSMRMMLRLIIKDADLNLDSDNPVTMTREIRTWIAQQKTSEEVRQNELQIAKLERDNAIADFATAKLREFEAVQEMSFWRQAAALLFFWFIFSLVAFAGIFWEAAAKL